MQMTVEINFNLLDEDAPPDLPTRWDAAHVGLRIVEGFVTLRSVPDRRFGHVKAAWPQYWHELEDVAEAQAQLDTEKNAPTRVNATVREIAHAIETTYWAAKYLALFYPRYSEAVNAVAHAHSLGFDAGWITRKRGGYADTWMQLHEAGCQHIADGLSRDNVWVF